MTKPVDTVDEHPPDAASDVSAWVSEVEDLLVRFQIAIELLTREAGVAPEVKQLMDELRARIRRLRVEAPNSRAVQTWLRALSITARGPARFVNHA